ncbi:MAG TPA: hypothetical protein IAB73_00420 [Candidatus Onthenecus intestinigallinarum]|uniref:CARDB domain-containing protein n=1 Tax=Candidatus Onthenecus intestinigallinarum TaxID=2840875 RepID=A0A9D1CPB8_9FIRM|nr:hypothetical protein [Candidatus Onthenecus intestinigallinarum]
MKCRSMVLGLLLLAFALALALPASAEYDPITTSSACVPNTLVEPGPVDVTIKVYNSGDTDMQSPMTLYDPNGEAVENFVDVTLAAGQSQSWNGTWNVSQEEMAEGKLRFALRYELNAGGAAVQVNKTIAVSIQQDAPAPSLTASYTVTPNPAQEGAEVTLTYTLSNTGNVAVTNVQITNEELTDERINISRIETGERVTREFVYEMGDEAVTFKPKVTYRADGSDRVLTIGTMAQETIEVAEGDLELELVGGENVVGAMPGDKATLTLTMRNTGNITYSNIQITDSVLGEIESGLELGPGEEKTVQREFTVQESADHAFTVTAVSSAGGEIEHTSNKVSVVALDLERAVNLEVSAEAGQTVIREKPAVVAFAVTVRNIGEVDAQNVELYQGDTLVATIDSIPAGEEDRVVKEYSVSMEGTFQFTAVSYMEVEQQEEPLQQRFDSPEVVLAYVEATPEPVTPPPTLAPEATVEPVATEAPETGASAGMVALYVLAGVLGVALLAVLGLMIAARLRGEGSPAAAAVDGFERGGSRSYTARPGTQRRRPRERVELEPRADDEPRDEGAEQAAPDVPPARGRRSRPEPEQPSAAGAEQPESAAEPPVEAAPEEETAAEPEVQPEPAPEAERPAAPERRARAERRARPEPEEEEDDYGEPVDAPAKPARAKRGFLSGLLRGRRKVGEDDYVAPVPNEEPDDVQPEEDMDKTVLYDRELFNRIRESAGKEGGLSEQDQLLMQGGTGSYRLSRSVRDAAPKPAEPSGRSADDDWIDEEPEDDPYVDGPDDASRGRRKGK